MRRQGGLATACAVLAVCAAARAADIRVALRAARLEIRSAGEHAVRVTLQPRDARQDFPYTPALVERPFPEPALRLHEMTEPVHAAVGTLQVDVSGDPLAVTVAAADGRVLQTLTFNADGTLAFATDDQPILGLGEGGPLPRGNWREADVQFDRRGAVDEMRPRWQGDAYGSRNPVALLAGTSGWALFIATPWGEVDLRAPGQGKFTPWRPPAPLEERDDRGGGRAGEQARNARNAQLQGRPPEDAVVPGAFDVFVFDARDPPAFLNDLASLTGRAAMPPKWALGYMQSHRTLRDERQLAEIVDTFRAKRIPIDSVVYLGTGFCPRGWNTQQPSYEFNPEVFTRDPAVVIADLHNRHVKVILHVIPLGRDRLPTLHGTIPPAAGETLDAGHIAAYWKLHEPLLAAGADAFWPDEGDWFNLHERMTRHQMYYQGPLATRPGVRPWSLHRNGHLGIARWGGWVWSGDTDSSWKTLEAQVAVGINHSLSLSPFWGSDIGGFTPNRELTGELYARWFQFGAFCPSFRSHGRTWWTRLPWGWGLSEMGPREARENPLDAELNNPAIEPVCRKYAELRYQLMPYAYTMARQACDSGLPMMRALWLHYPDDAIARGLGSEYLWGRDLLVAPVFARGATSRAVYLPAGAWYDWWTNERRVGGQWVTREVDLATMPLYVRAGAIIPVDPVRQYVDETTDEPTTLRVYAGADGEFTLYEDDGATLDYLRGEATWTRITWNDEGRRLAIEPGRPSAGASPRRRFRVELLPEGQSAVVEFAGAPVETKF